MLLALIIGGPKIAAPLRVSTTRHGVTGKNASGFPCVCWVNVAITICGPLIVTVVDATFGLTTLLVQLANWYPAAGVATIGAELPAL